MTSCKVVYEEISRASLCNLGDDGEEESLGKDGEEDHVEDGLGAIRSR